MTGISKSISYHVKFCRCIIPKLRKQNPAHYSKAVKAGFFINLHLNYVDIFLKERSATVKGHVIKLAFRMRDWKFHRATSVNCTCAFVPFLIQYTTTASSRSPHRHVRVSDVRRRASLALRLHSLIFLITREVNN